MYEQYDLKVVFLPSQVDWIVDLDCSPLWCVPRNERTIGKNKQTDPMFPIDSYIISYVDFVDFQWSKNFGMEHGWRETEKEFMQGTQQKERKNRRAERRTSERIWFIFLFVFVFSFDGLSREWKAWIESGVQRHWLHENVSRRHKSLLLAATASVNSSCDNTDHSVLANRFDSKEDCD